MIKVKVEDVMSEDLIVAYVPGTVKEALKILAEHNVSGMPILKEDTKKVVGVLTRSDIFRNPDEDQLALVMSKDFLYVDKDDDVKKAAEIFYNHRIHGLPVLNNRGNLVGIISPTDIVRKVLIESEESVKDFYTSKAVPVYKKTPINVVMEIINVTHENALPVLDDDLKLIGMISDGDVFKHSSVKEGITMSNMGLGEDEDQWTWEGIRDSVRMYHSTSELEFPDITVEEVMVTNLVKTFENSKVCDVAEKIVKKKIGQLPVVNAENRLLGMITDIDLMRCII